MAPAPRVPIELTRGPFDLEQARRHGVSRTQLRGATWRRLGTGLYVWREIAEQPVVQLIAATHRLPDTAVFTGLTAAWLHGLDANPCSPIDVTVPKTNHVARRIGLALHRADIPATERSTRRGLRVTSAVRTVADLGRGLPLIDAVALLDMGTHAQLVTRNQLREWVETHPRCRGLGNLTTAVELCEPATESVMETRLRLLLVLAGLPRPKVQYALRDDSDQLIARPDLYYPGARLAIEYDGATHRVTLATDNRRQNRLIDAGYRILRFTAGDVLNAPAGVVGVVRRSLASGGR